MPTLCDQAPAPLEYCNGIPVKMLFSVDNEKVKSYADLIESINNSIEYIKKLEKDGWVYDYEQSGDWLFFTNTDRKTAIKELGLNDVLEQEQSKED